MQGKESARKNSRAKSEQWKNRLKLTEHYQLEKIFKAVNAKLRGHYQYYGITDNTKEVENFLTRTKWLLFKWLNRRSQKRSYILDTFFRGISTAVTYKKKKQQLAEVAQISPATISKMVAGENVTMEVVGKVCRALNVTIDEIVDFIPVK